MRTLRGPALLSAACIMAALSAAPVFCQAESVSGLRHSENAKTAIGPYSQSVKAGDFLFVSGQIPLKPGAAAIEAGTVEDQTRQVLENIKRILAAAGASLSQAVKMTVYVTDINHYAAVNKVYAEYFPAPAPARACLGVKELVKGALVEMDCIAYVGK